MRFVVNGAVTLAAIQVYEHLGWKVDGPTFVLVLCVMMLLGLVDVVFDVVRSK